MLTAASGALQARGLPNSVRPLGMNDWLAWESPGRQGVACPCRCCCCRAPAVPQQQRASPAHETRLARQQMHAALPHDLRSAETACFYTPSSSSPITLSLAMPKKMQLTRLTGWECFRHASGRRARCTRLLPEHASLSAATEAPPATPLHARAGPVLADLGVTERHSSPPSENRARCLFAFPRPLMLDGRAEDAESSGCLGSLPGMPASLPALNFARLASEATLCSLGPSEKPALPGTKMSIFPNRGLQG